MHLDCWLARGSDGRSGDLFLGLDCPGFEEEGVDGGLGAGRGGELVGRGFFGGGGWWGRLLHGLGCHGRGGRGSGWPVGVDGAVRKEEVLDGWVGG